MYRTENNEKHIVQNLLDRGQRIINSYIFNGITMPSISLDE